MNGLPVELIFIVVTVAVCFACFVVEPYLAWRRRQQEALAGGASAAVRKRSTPEAGQPVARIATPADPVALPAPATPLQVPDLGMDRRAATLSAIRALPAHIAHSEEIRADHLPLMHDGRGWQSISIKRSQHYGLFSASRQGKGNALQLLALSALRLGPETVQLVVLDPKSGLDYGFCTELDHARLYADGIPCDGGLTDGYQSVKAEMDRRNIMLYKARARNIHEYNARHSTPEPFLLVIADEVAELNADQRAVLDSVARMGGSSWCGVVCGNPVPHRRQVIVASPGQHPQSVCPTARIA